MEQFGQHHVRRPDVSAPTMQIELILSKGEPLRVGVGLKSLSAVSYGAELRNAVSNTLQSVGVVVTNRRHKNQGKEAVCDIMADQGEALEAAVAKALKQTLESGPLLRLHKEGTVNYLLADEGVRAALQAAGHRIGKKSCTLSVKSAIARASTKVKEETQTREERASACVKEILTCLPVALPEFSDTWVSDDEIHEDSSLSFMGAMFSAELRSSNSSAGSTKFILPTEFADPAAMVEKFSTKMPIASCNQQPCLLCLCCSNPQTQCPFSRRSTYHWMRAYQALLVALHGKGLLQDTVLTDAQRTVVQCLEERLASPEQYGFIKSEVCPDAVVASLDACAGAKPTIRSIKLALSAGIAAFAAENFDAMKPHETGLSDEDSLFSLHDTAGEHSDAGEGSAEEGTHWIESDDSVDPEQGTAKDSKDSMPADEPEKVDSSTDEEVPEGGCETLRSLKIQCPDHARCINRPFDPSVVLKAPAASVRLAGKHKGLGLFASGPIDAAKLVGEYTGVRLRHKPEDSRYCVRLKDGTFVDAKAAKNGRVKFANHTCSSPNCELQEWRVRGKRRLGLFTTRSISTTEELVWTYHDTIQFECYCGQSDCTRPGLG